MSKSKEWFAPITVSRLRSVERSQRPCWPLFAILVFENMTSRGKPFALPDNTPDATLGI